MQISSRALWLGSTPRRLPLKIYWGLSGKEEPRKISLPAQERRQSDFCPNKPSPKQENTVGFFILISFPAKLKLLPLAKHCMFLINWAEVQEQSSPP